MSEEAPARSKKWILALLVVPAVLAVVFIVGSIVLVRQKSAQLAEAAEMAYPGPLPDH